MKILVSGSRNNVDYDIIGDALKILNEFILNDELSKNNSTVQYTLINGGANGVDSQFATILKNNKKFQILTVNANWKLYGRGAGPKRNQEMVDMIPDYGIFIPSVDSVGTYDCLNRFKKLNKPYILYDVNKKEFIHENKNTNQIN